MWSILIIFSLKLIDTKQSSWIVSEKRTHTKKQKQKQNNNESFTAMRINGVYGVNVLVQAATKIARQHNNQKIIVCIAIYWHFS